MTNILSLTPIFIPRCSIFNSTHGNVELCGINIYPTQPLAYSTPKVLFHVTISYSTSSSYSTFAAWNKYLWFYSTLVFFIPRWPVLFHTIPRKVWSKSQMLEGLPRRPRLCHYQCGWCLGLRVTSGQRAHRGLPRRPRLRHSKRAGGRHP